MKKEDHPLHILLKGIQKREERIKELADFMAGFNTYSICPTKQLKDLVKVRPELENLVNRIEQTARPTEMIKIKLAAFCEILFDRKYLTSQKNRIKTCNSFSLSRYNIDIKVQLNSSNKKDRENHKSILYKHFK